MLNSNPLAGQQQPTQNNDPDWQLIFSQLSGIAQWIKRTKLNNGLPGMAEHGQQPFNSQFMLADYSDPMQGFLADVGRA